MLKYSFPLLIFFLAIAYHTFANNSCLQIQKLSNPQNVESTIQDTFNLSINSDTVAVNDSTKSKYWKINGLASLNFSQTFISHWVEGGESAIAGLGIFNIRANYSKNNSQWDNSFDIKYGLIKPGENSFRKNEDKLDISTKFGQKAFNKFYYSLMLSLKSQIAKGYEFPNDSDIISGFMSPGYLMIAIGMDYKPNDKISILLSPLTSKSTYVLNDSVDVTKFDLAEGEKIRRETGAFIKTKIKFKLMDNITLDSKLDLFTNYKHNPQNIDVNWELAIAMKVNKYIVTSINAHLVYDDDISIPIERTRINADGVLETYMGTTKTIQFKELLSIGVTYKF